MTLTPGRSKNGSVVLSRARSGSVRVRSYEPGDFEAAYRLDQSCYPPGIAYSRYALREFLTALGSRAWVSSGRWGPTGATSLPWIST
jgi:hypothetical protein